MMHPLGVRHLQDPENTKYVNINNNTNNTAVTVSHQGCYSWDKIRGMGVLIPVFNRVYMSDALVFSLSRNPGLIKVSGLL